MFSVFEELSKYVFSIHGTTSWVRQTDHPQASLAHQLLPADQQTKPSEVRARLFHPPRSGLTRYRISHTFHPSSARSRPRQKSVLIWRHWSSISERHRGAKEDRRVQLTRQRERGGDDGGKIEEVKGKLYSIRNERRSPQLNEAL